MKVLGQEYFSPIKSPLLCPPTSFVGLPILLPLAFKLEVLELLRQKSEINLLESLVETSHLCLSVPKKVTTPKPVKK